MLIDLLEPVLYVIECSQIGAIVHEDDSHCALVVCLCNCAEALLTCRVPYLKLHTLVIHVDLFYLEVNA